MAGFAITYTPNLTAPNATPGRSQSKIACTGSCWQGSTHCICQLRQPAISALPPEESRGVQQLTSQAWQLRRISRLRRAPWSVPSSATRLERRWSSCRLLLRSGFAELHTAATVSKSIIEHTGNCARMCSYVPVPFMQRHPPGLRHRADRRWWLLTWSWLQAGQRGADDAGRRSVERRAGAGDR